MDFWKGDLKDINNARDSKPSLLEVIDQIKDFFEIVKEKNLPLSRIHLHPYGSFFMCYDVNLWDDAKEAIIKSSLVSPKYCIMSENLED